VYWGAQLCCLLLVAPNVCCGWLLGDHCCCWFVLVAGAHCSHHASLTSGTDLLSGTYGVLLPHTHSALDDVAV